jgi:hypothetical protein
MSKPAAILFAAMTAAPAVTQGATPTAAKPNGWSYPVSGRNGNAWAFWVKQYRRTEPDRITCWRNHEGLAT